MSKAAGSKLGYHCDSQSGAMLLHNQREALLLLSSGGMRPRCEGLAALSPPSTSLELDQRSKSLR